MSTVSAGNSDLFKIFTANYSCGFALELKRNTLPKAPSPKVIPVALYDFLTAVDASENFFITLCYISFALS